MEHIHYSIELATKSATIILNHPQRHNALEAQDIDKLIEYLRQAEEHPEIRVIIITGAGEKTFCAGASLTQLRDHSLRGDAFSTLAQSIYQLQTPTICLLNGSVYGGGVELALACDFRLGMTHSQLQVPVAKLGLAYSSFGLQLYHAVLGLSTSKRILCSAEKFDAQQLYQLGFFDAIFEQPQLAQQHAVELSQRIAQLAPLAVGAMRATLNELAINDFNPQRSAQREQLCLASEDKREGFAAALEKRKAEFKNK